MNVKHFKPILLGVIGLAICAQVYFGWMLGPLRAREEQARGVLAASEPKIAAMRKLQKTENDLATRAPETRAHLQALRASVPEGEPLAWFPPRVLRVLRKEGVPRANIRLINTLATTEHEGFQQLAWTIDIPQTSYIALGAAIAELENREPLLEIQTLSIAASPSDPEFERATLEAQIFVTK